MTGGPGVDGNQEFDLFGKAGKFLGHSHSRRESVAWRLEIFPGMEREAWVNLAMKDHASGLKCCREEHQCWTTGRAGLTTQ